jgi:hypothetical protein
MWLGALHLLFGNLFIGIVEGFLLSLLFGAPRGKSILLFIAANYFSAFVGYFLLEGPIRHMIHPTLSNAWLIFWLLMAGTFLLTLVLEFPFALFALRGRPSYFKNAIFGTLVVQSASYLVLAWLYWGASGTTLYTETTVVDPAKFRMPPNVEIVFTSATNGVIYSDTLSDRRWVQIADQYPKSGKSEMVFRRVSDKIMGISLEIRDGDVSIPVLPYSDTKLYEAPCMPASNLVSAEKKNGEPWTFYLGSIPTLGEAESSHWSFETGFWAIEGLHGNNNKTGESRYIAWETLFTKWPIHKAILLPGDIVLFQLGADQICLYDPNLKTLCLLCRGRNAIAYSRRTEIKEPQSSEAGTKW